MSTGKFPEVLSQRILAGIILVWRLGVPSFLRRRGAIFSACFGLDVLRHADFSSDCWGRWCVVSLRICVSVFQYAANLFGRSADPRLCFIKKRFVLPVLPSCIPEVLWWWRVMMINYGYCIYDNDIALNLYHLWLCQNDFSKTGGQASWVHVARHSD